MTEYVQPFGRPEKNNRPVFNSKNLKDPIIQHKKQKTFTPPFAQSSQSKNSSLNTIMPFEEAVAYEHVQFGRWLNMFKNPGKGGKTRKIGSRKIFDNFFKEMMPPDLKYSWEQEKHPYLFVVRDSKSQKVFWCEGTQRDIFIKLVQHYGNNRTKYFQRKYNAIMPKQAFSSIIKKGLAPPPDPVIKEVEITVEKEVPVEVEVPVKVEVEVPGKPVDRLQEALTNVPPLIKQLLDGNKKLPNRFRHIYQDPKVLTEGDGMIHVSLVLGP